MDSKGRILIRDKIELEGRGTGGEREEVRGGGTHSSACMCAIILAILKGKYTAICSLPYV